jgi:hypothetical protein
VAIPGGTKDVSELSVVACRREAEGQSGAVRLLLQSLDRGRLEWLSVRVGETPGQPKQTANPGADVSVEASVFAASTPAQPNDEARVDPSGEPERCRRAVGSLTR